MRCWRGCDAYIVAPYFTGAVGRVVHIEREAGRFECFGGDAFTHEYDCTIGWVVSGRIPMDDGRVLSKVVISDHCLRPITPPPGTVLDEAANLTPADIANFFAVPYPAHV